MSYTVETTAVGDGSTKLFGFNFEVALTDSVNVEVDGTAVPFTISGSSVELDAAPATGAVVRIYRSTNLDGLRYQYQLGAPFLPSTVDANNLQLLYALQENQFNVARFYETLLRVPTTDAAIAALPTATTRAGKLLSFDAEGQPTVTVPAVGSVTELAADLADGADEAKGASLVRFQQTGANAVSRTLRDKVREVVSVKDFGAVGDGVTDDTLSFQRAADYAASIATDYMRGKNTILKAPTAKIEVPDGDYVLSAQVTSSAQLVWNFSAGAICTAGRLTGVVSRVGRHINADHTGILENSCTLSLRANSDLGNIGGVYGITSLDAMSVNGPPHSVTLQIDNATKSKPVTLTGTTFTLTSVTYTNSPDLSNLKIGSTLTVQGAPQYIGQITGVDELTKTITVADAWRPFTGVSGSVGTPTDGNAVIVDYYEKLWGQNTNVTLQAGSPTARAAGYEMGVLNYQSDSAPLNFTVVQKPSIWGFDAVNLGPYKSSVAFSARCGASAWRTGFASYGNEIGFQVFKRAGFTTAVGFSYEAGEGTAFRSVVNGLSSFSINYAGSMEVGRQDAAQVTTVDLHSSGYANDYDARLQCAGGVSTAGAGALTIYAASVDIGATLRPVTDNYTALGSPGQRWSTVYAGTGTINTSDGREKQQVRELSEVERAVASRLKGLLRAFKFNDAVELKGDGARWHFGVIAQDVKAAFEAEGLVAEDYAILCYDEWEEQPEIMDDEGNVAHEYRPAGNRYGVRYDELFAFIISVL